VCGLIDFLESLFPSTPDKAVPESGFLQTVSTFDGHSGDPLSDQPRGPVGGRTEQAYGTACRQPDGSWQIVS